MPQNSPLHLTQIDAANTPQRKPGIHWKGHVFLFEKPEAPRYSTTAGLRLLLIFLVLEEVIGPKLHLFRWMHLPLPPTWVRIPCLLTAALLLVRFFAGVRLSDLGLKRWSAWSGTEKSYFIQILVITNLVFWILQADQLRLLVSSPTLAKQIGTVLAPYLLWGFYQEVIYRGILQTELVRRWGALPGILVSNLLFTFGPLHFYHFSRTPHPLAVFAAIFAIGLFFGIVFRRSGNLWINAVAHGLGNVYLDGMQQH